MCTVRVYLLYLLGCTLFDDRSGIRMSVDYLVLLHDIHSVNTYTWGAGALLSCIDNWSGIKSTCCSNC